MRPLPVPGLPGAQVAGTTRRDPEDFEVEEIPLTVPTGEGHHLWLRVRKRGLSTFDAIERIARRLGVQSKQCGHAGLKDKNAITEQWISIPGIEADALKAFQFDAHGLEILEAVPHHSRLKTGQLRGNRFRIRIHGPGESAVEPLRRNLEWFQKAGVPNWFGEQRFGSGGRNLEKGLRILHEPQAPGLRRVRKQLVKLLVASVQSEIFHHVLAERLDTLSTLGEGDIAWLHHNGACFLVEDAGQEQIRADAFEISPTGPLPGPKMLRAKGEAGELETAVFDALELQPADFGKLPFPAAPGARRPLRVRLTEPEVTWGEQDGLRIAFALERGAFATTVLRELLLDQPWFEDADREDTSRTDASSDSGEPGSRESGPRESGPRDPGSSGDD